MGQKPGLILQDKLTVDELSILNHELGNVLNGLSGMAGLLRDSGLTVEQDRWLEAIEQSGRQMCRIMESTLDYRGDTGDGMGVRPGRMSGIGLLEDIMISHAPAALAKGLQFVLVTERELPANWYSDGGLLRQLLDNLVGNAIKFTATGHVILRAAVSEGGALELSVCDSGPGVSQPESMFDPWRRGTSASVDHPGSGLGLFVCRRIVESMGGTLAANREPTGGSRFWARIPGMFESHRFDATGIRSLARMHCRLDLEQPMLESAQSFLDRLGVMCSCNDEQPPFIDAFYHEVLIDQAGAGSGVTGLGISLSEPGTGSPAVFLATPVLESGLEQALFQLLLQLRFEDLTRSGKQG